MKPLNRQTTIDIALQYCGTAEQAMQFALQNGISITDSLNTNTDYFVPTAQKKEIAQYYLVNKLTPARQDESTSLQEGIDFWAIEVDFIVQ